MNTPPTLDEIDLGPEKRRIEFKSIVSMWWYLGMAIFGIALILVGMFAIPATGGRPGTDDATTMKWLMIGIGGIILVVDVGLFAVMFYLDGEKLLVFADGVCWEWKSRQECFRWKDVEKIVHFASDPRVYWLHFKTGRKVCVSLLGGVSEKDWSALRRLLEKKIPDKFEEED